MKNRDRYAALIDASYIAQEVDQALRLQRGTDGRNAR